MSVRGEEGVAEGWDVPEAPPPTLGVFIVPLCDVLCMFEHVFEAGLRRPLSYTTAAFLYR